MRSNAELDINVFRSAHMRSNAELDINVFRSAHMRSNAELDINRTQIQSYYAQFNLEYIRRQAEICANCITKVVPDTSDDDLQFRPWNLAYNLDHSLKGFA